MTTLEDAPIALTVSGDESETETDEPRRRRHRLVWPVLGAVLLAVGAGVWLWTKNSSTESSPSPAGPVATAAVERGTISATESWDGTLDHGTPLSVDSSREGTVTRLIGQGQAVERGTELLRVDEQPVILLYGVVPMYRDLGSGDSGADVEQLEANLAESGYTGFTADDEYTESTADAVRAWQTDTGAESTGTVARGDVVFVPDAGRVDALHVSVGDLVTPGRAILDITGTAEVVTVEADVEDRGVVANGTQVTAVLPSGDEVAGTVSSSTVVEVPAEPAASAGGGNQRETRSLTIVEITLTADVDDSLAGAPVDVVVPIDERQDVLHVPVNALLALAEGGYGLEVVGEDGTTEIVPVDTGLFADGRVEVSGAGITEGAVVGVAGR